MMRNVICLLFLQSVLTGYGQDQQADTAKILQPVLIQAFAASRPLNEVAASVAYIGAEALNRFNNTSVLPAVNTIPGVRMEERSPGSYRFSIRGSLLRSPFGVRNVKVYWNGLPLTDGGGNTYLNLVDFNAIGNMEIIKGPGGSLYGAGTGGVLLLNSPLIKNDQSEISALAGSDGLLRYQASQQFHSKNINLRVQYAGQQYDGYREQTAMNRGVFNADLVFPLSGKSTLSATLFYSNLFYETPGGLTKAQYDEDPKQARPAAGTNKGAVEQKASITNKTPYAGFTLDHDWNPDWSTRIAMFGSYTDFKNPAIRNYEERTETNAGARTETSYTFGSYKKSKLTLGGEYQYFHSPITVYDNNLGQKGAVQTDDWLSSQLALFFAQTQMEFNSGFFLTAGASINFLEYRFRQYQPTPLISQSVKFKTVFSPRIALLKKITQNFSLYGNVSRGFSPPSLAEVRPSTDTFNNDLEPETGTNYEVGFRGNTLTKRFSFDVTAYDFNLKQTIVIQRASDGAEFFVNAGETSQQGIEAVVSWTPVLNAAGVVSEFKIWSSYAYNHYRFKDYIQDGSDFAGNELTGIPPAVNASGLDLTVRQRFYLNLTTNYVDHIPLNDANTTYAKEYLLAGFRAGYTTKIQHTSTLDIFGGIDNIQDKKYSLGNDLNAIGGRYFNAAPGRNFYFGMRFILTR